VFIDDIHRDRSFADRPFDEGADEEKGVIEEKTVATFRGNGLEGAKGIGRDLVFIARIVLGLKRPGLLEE
jgi:hypothetical protein